MVLSMKLSKTDSVNLGLIGLTASAVVYAFTTFADADDIDAVRQEHRKDIKLHDKYIKSIQLDQWFSQFYARLDSRDASSKAGNKALVAEYERQMERLKARICEVDAEWERCNE